MQCETNEVEIYVTVELYVTVLKLHLHLVISPDRQVIATLSSLLTYNRIVSVRVCVRSGNSYHFLDFVRLIGKLFSWLQK